MHSPQVLREQVFPVEVVIDWMVYARRRRAHVTSPESELDVLCTNVTLPFILGREG
jgi:hypothetical protein